jgi:hypothetical protein
MTVRRRDWYLVAALLLAIVVLLRAFPRYEWRDVSGNPFAMIRLDRWTGNAEFGRFGSDSRWHAGFTAH